MGVSGNLSPSPMYPWCVSLAGCADGVVGLRILAESFLLDNGPMDPGVSICQVSMWLGTAMDADVRRTVNCNRRRILLVLEVGAFANGRWVCHLDLGYGVCHIDLSRSGMDLPRRHPNGT